MDRRRFIVGAAAAVAGLLGIIPGAEHVEYETVSKLDSYDKRHCTTGFALYVNHQAADGLVGWWQPNRQGEMMIDTARLASAVPRQSRVMDLGRLRGAER